MPNTEPLLTVSEVAALAKVHPETVRRWTRSGELAALTLPGGQKRYERSAVNAMLGYPQDAA